MLVPILNTTDRSGGAGIAAFRQSQALAADGVLAPVLCLHRRFSDSSTFRCRPRNSESSPSLQHLRDALQSVQRRFVQDNRSSVSRTIFSPPWSGGLLVADNPLVAASRVLHLHWINQFLDLHSLEELSFGGRPVVWTMHDEWLFSGGCHYTTGCERFLERCRDCPQLLHDPYGLVEHWFDQKARLLAKMNLVVVTPSQWLADRARRSSLLRDKRIDVVRNAFDDRVFAPRAPAERAALRHRFGFDDQTVVLGFGAQSLLDARKGFGLLVEALASLHGAIRVGLLVFGSRSERLDSLGGGMQIAYAGELHDSAEIADVLAAADCFVVPSLEENYPNVIVEALLCGTPVIGYACGGIPEQLRDRENGLLVKPVGSAQALAEALRQFITDRSLRAGLRAFDRDAVARRHSYDSIAKELLSLYRSICPDFDQPLDPSLREYLDRCAERKGPARDFLAVPSFRSVGDDTLVCTLVADHVDRQRELREMSARSAHDRLYLGFFGSTHRFGRGSDGIRFLNYGWSSAEETGTWSSERTAGIAAWWPQDAQEVTLRLVGWCRGTSQVAIFRLGTKEIGRVKLSSTRQAHELRFDVPEAFGAGGIVQIHIDFPHCQPEPGGARRLGMHLVEISAQVRCGSSVADRGAGQASRTT